MTHLGNSYSPVNWRHGSLEISFLKLRKPWGVPISWAESHQGSEYHVRWKKQTISPLVIAAAWKPQTKGRRKNWKDGGIFFKSTCNLLQNLISSPSLYWFLKIRSLLFRRSLMWLQLRWMVFQFTSLSSTFWPQFQMNLFEKFNI